LEPDAVVGEATWQELYRRRSQLFPTPAPTVSPTPTSSPTPTTSPTQPPTSGTGQRARIVADIPAGEEVQVFDGPGSEYARLRILSNGSEVVTTGRQSGNWTELEDGGWVFSAWVQPI
ncbi:hypothetical protein C7271_16565, partial [filamentous cyanobacterium CCP5]